MRNDQRRGAIGRQNGKLFRAWSRDLQKVYERATHSGWYFQYDDIREGILGIQFSSQKDFEILWPSILSLKSKGAPLILRNGPSSYRQRDSIIRGVHILHPDIYGLSESGINQQLLASMHDLSQTPPEYVQNEEGTWKPFSGVLHKPLPKSSDMPYVLNRTRTDIILVVDGDVVDLNRIPFPKDTLITDQRFTEQGAAIDAAAHRD